MAPRLANASVNFHTNDEDKDYDTHVSITVTDEDGVTAARIDSDFTHFPDHSDAGQRVHNESTKESLQRGTITIRVDPNGHDTWRFNWFLDLVFSDGSVLARKSRGIS